MKSQMAFAEFTPLKIDMRGAVLCSYSIAVAMESAAHKCLTGKAELKKALSYSLEKHRQFILRNAPVDQQYLSEFEKEHSVPENVSCEMLAENGFNDLLERVIGDTQAYIDTIDESLSVDREPVWNPCL